MKILFRKDKNRRFFFFFIEKKILILKYIINNLKLKKDIRNFAFMELKKFLEKFSHTKIRNRCILSNRARASYRKFKMSRLFFKKYGLSGKLTGVKKASW